MQLRPQIALNSPLHSLQDTAVALQLPDRGHEGAKYDDLVYKITA